jgi:hypothetical protein
VELKVGAIQGMEGDSVLVLMAFKSRRGKKKLEKKTTISVKGVDPVKLTFLQRQDGSSWPCQCGRELCAP